MWVRLCATHDSGWGLGAVKGADGPDFMVLFDMFEVYTIRTVRTGMYEYIAPMVLRGNKGCDAQSYWKKVTIADEEATYSASA